MSMMTKLPLIVITGPTGVGKTELSIRLAKKINGEIISADSIQVYRYFNIGSAKITPSEMQGVKHYLIDILNPDEEFNVYRFKQFALEAMHEIYAKNKIPIIVGGTGFYIQSILYDIDFSTEESEDRAVREKYEEIAAVHGADYLHGMLKEVDPKSAEFIHKNNIKRVIRALEYYEHTGEQISVHNEREAGKQSPYNFMYFVLNRERDILYQRINKRVDKMIDDGLVEEVKGLLDMGYSRNLVSMQGLGYKEIAAFLNGEYTLEDAIERIKQDTRHFAKRQLTWFRREKEVTFVNYEDYENDIERICEVFVQMISAKGIKGIEQTEND